MPACPPARPGAFWLAWTDFLDQFNQIYVCEECPSGWKEQHYSGKWSGQTEGSQPGGRPPLGSFPSNPQYGFKLDFQTKLKVTVEQADLRWKKQTTAYQNGVGFTVVKLTGKKRPVDANGRREGVCRAGARRTKRAWPGCGTLRPRPARQPHRASLAPCNERIACCRALAGAATSFRTASSAFPWDPNTPSLRAVA